MKHIGRYSGSYISATLPLPSFPVVFWNVLGIHSNGLARESHPLPFFSPLYAKEHLYPVLYFKQISVVCQPAGLHAHPSAEMEYEYRHGQKQA